MKSIPSGIHVSWTELARKYQVRNAQGNAPEMQDKHFSNLHARMESIFPSSFIMLVLTILGAILTPIFNLPVST
jgi:hypothetical protein